MAAELKHTLTNLEITPPEGAWNAIASRLDAEFDTTEIILSEKIGDFELPPPANAWHHIEAALVAEPEEAEMAPVIIFNRPFRKWAAAAAAILVVALGGWYFFNNTAATDNSVTKIPQPTTAPQQVAPDVPVDVPDVATAPVDDRPLPRRSGTLVASASRVKLAQAASFQFEQEPVYYYEEPVVQEKLQPADLPYIEPSITNDVPNVEAPPIRDADGNIILDKELISAPDNNYIIVTGPNGEQTRISSKFLPLLSSMNGSTEATDYFTFFLNENNIWKLRFNEWRDMMLKKATLIPTATNLLDLLELKDILQEN